MKTQTIFLNGRQFTCTKTRFKTGYRWILAQRHIKKIPTWIATEKTYQDCIKLLLKN